MKIGREKIFEINVICNNYNTYRFYTEDIEELNNDEKSLRILFTDGSYVHFVRSNIICIEYNTKEGMKKHE